MEYVNVKYKVYWQFKEYHHLKVTKCKKIINTKNGAILKQHIRGYFIDDRYIKREGINNHLEIIPKKKYCPFSNRTIEI